MPYASKEARAKRDSERYQSLTAQEKQGRIKRTHDWRDANPQAPLEHFYVSWDSESLINGQISFLQNNLGYERDGNPLTIRDVLPSLCLRQHEGRAVWNVWYSFGLDINLLCAFEDRETQRRLFNPPGEVWIDDYQLKYVPRKSLTIRHNGDTFRHFDTHSWFQTSFIGALTDYKIPVPEIVREGKGIRDRLADKGVEWGKDYNRVELQSHVTLMDKLRASVDAMCQLTKLSPLTSWHGPGALASKFLRNNCNAGNVRLGDFAPWERWSEQSQTMWEIESQLEKYFDHYLDFSDFRKQFIKHRTWDYYRRLSMYGGRIEGAMRGAFDTVHNYDIRNAYGTAITKLPDLRPPAHFRTFTDFNENNLDQYDYGLVEVEWNCEDEWVRLGPFPFRCDGSDWTEEYCGNQDNGIIFPAYREKGSYKGVYHVGEVHEAVRKGLWNIRFTGRAWMLEDVQNFPFKPIEELLNLRMEWRGKDNPADKAVKLMINSSFGVTAKKYGARAFYSLYELFYAGFITSWTRSQLLKYANPETTILFATDGAYSTEKLACPISDRWGDWEYEKGSMQMILPGIYKFQGDHTPPDKWVKKRGYPQLDFDRVWEQVTKTGKCDVLDRLFIGIRKSLANPKAYPTPGFYDTKKTIDWTHRNTKRIPMSWIEEPLSYPRRSTQTLSRPAPRVDDWLLEQGYGEDWGIDSTRQDLGEIIDTYEV